MTGGAITNNHAEHGNGGGVEALAIGTIDDGYGLYMAGGSITYNTAEGGNGGGIFTINHENLYIGSDATVADNEPDDIWSELLSMAASGRNYTPDSYRTISLTEHHALHKIGRIGIAGV